MTVDPIQAVEDALAAQTAAISALAAELADEHQQWLDAVAAGDAAQAAAIVGKVNENTAALNKMSADLAASVPGGAPVEPEVPVEPEPEVPVEPEVPPTE